MNIRKRQSSMIQNMIFNGNTNTNNSNNNNSNNNEDEGIILSSTFMKDKASLLESAFDAMDDRDKYDAVLTGLCSKILDNQGRRNTNNNNNAAANAANAEGGGDDDVMNGNMNNNNNNYNAAAAANVVDEIASDATLTPTQLAMKTMKDPIRLLEEMNASRVKASSRSLMALVDVSTGVPMKCQCIKYHDFECLIHPFFFVKLCFMSHHLYISHSLLFSNTNTTAT